MYRSRNFFQKSLCLHLRSNYFLLFAKIQPKLKGGEGVDVGYWETLSQLVAAQMARTRLRERHQEHLRRKLTYLKQNQGITSSDREPMFPSGSNPTNSIVERIQELRQKTSERMMGDELMESSEMEEKPHSAEKKSSSTALAETPTNASGEPDPYDSSLYSPVLLTQADVEIDAVLYDANDDWAKLEYQVCFRSVVSIIFIFEIYKLPIIHSLLNVFSLL